MIKKYKIGNFTAKIESTADFHETENYSLFLYEGTQTDYKIKVDFMPEFPETITYPSYETADRVYLTENGVNCCYYKSREKGTVFYAKRKTEGKNISILIDEKYHNLLRIDVIFSLIGIEELVTENKGCILHSSYIVKDGGAILFTGPCSIGKSTQANLWKKYAGAEIVNGDKTLITENGNTLYAAGLPFSGSSKICLNITAPLKAIICLSKAKENSIKRIYSPKSFYDVYKNCYPVTYSKELTGTQIDFIKNMSQNIPVYEYSCLPDESAVRVLENELKQIISK